MVPWIYDNWPGVQRYSAAIGAPPVSAAYITALLWVRLCRLSVKNFQIAFGTVQSLSTRVVVDVWKNLRREKKPFDLLVRVCLNILYKKQKK